MVIVVYHGTAGSSVSGILKEINESTADKRLGAGVYFTSDKSVAERVATFRRDHSGQPGYAVFSYYLDDSNIKKMNGKEVCKNWKNEGYDGCTGTHPAWLDQNEFTEYCISNRSKFKLKDIWVYDANIDIGGEIIYENMHSERCKFTLTDDTTCKTQ
jgi:hypothetical protein